MAAQNLLHQRRPGPRKAHDENRLRRVGPHFRARQQAHVLAREKTLAAIKQRFNCFGPVLGARVLFQQLRLAGDEVLPGGRVVTQPVVDPPARQMCFSRKRSGCIENRQCLLVAAGPREISWLAAD